MHGSVMGWRMSEGGEKRRLAAVLMADIADYTRLVERDTDGTVSAWKAALRGRD